jgi:hypothetical protein
MSSPLDQSYPDFESQPFFAETVELLRFVPELAIETAYWEDPAKA